jgi:hypothetical protein
MNAINLDFSDFLYDHVKCESEPRSLHSGQIDPFQRGQGWHWCWSHFWGHCSFRTWLPNWLAYTRQNTRQQKDKEQGHDERVGSFPTYWY